MFGSVSGEDRELCLVGGETEGSDRERTGVGHNSASVSLLKRNSGGSA